MSTYPTDAADGHPEAEAAPNAETELSSDQLEAAAGGRGILDWIKGLFSDDDGFGGGTSGGAGAGSSW